MQKLKLQFMIKSILLLLLVFVTVAASAQVHTQIIGDSVRMRSNTGTTELILENSTKNVNGFLYNKGDGRTEFRPALVKLNDTSFVFGGDTMQLATAWKITGNSGTSAATNFLGTTDSTNLIIRTNNLQRMSVWGNGVVNIAGDDDTARPAFRVYPNGDFSASTNNDYTPDQNLKRNGIRFNKKLGLLEIGISNNVDTSLTLSQDSFETSGLIINSDNPNKIGSAMISTIIAGDGTEIEPGHDLNWSIIAGEQHRISGNFLKSMLNGHNQRISGPINMSFITGLSNTMHDTMWQSIVNGTTNEDTGGTSNSLINGLSNSYSGINQFMSGVGLISRSYSSATLGSANVDFTSLPRIPFINTTPPISELKPYPLFVIGNSNAPGTKRSNALTMLYSGRTQINTTGYDTALSESDVTPKAALEIVSHNSGILIPKLTNAQRDSIKSGDRINGLLLYNTDSSKFQFYNGTKWKSLCDSCTGPNYAIQSLHDSSTIVLNAANNINSTVTLTGSNRTVSVTNPIAGYTYRLKIVQDGTGSRTITDWPSGTLWPSGTPPVLSTTASSIDMVSLFYDGTNYFGDYKLLFKAPPAGPSILGYDAQSGYDPTVHSLTSVPAGTLLVVTTCAGSASSNASVSSSPSLTWTKRVDASASTSGDAEIYTAVYTAGGNITITSSWGEQPQASVCYQISGQESSLGGATATGTAQTPANVSITTTRANSLILAVSSDWNAVVATYSYTGSPTETNYAPYTGAGTFYHYYKQAASATSYTLGVATPSGQKSGTALLEIRGN